MPHQSDTAKKKKKKGQPHDSDSNEEQPPSTAKAKIPNIEWTANKSYLLWQVLSEAEKEPNRKVLFGKKSDQNSSPEHKTAVYKRIAASVIPKLYALDSSIAGDRVKGRIATFITTYRTHACRVMSTGRGLRDGRILDDRDAAGDPEAGDDSPGPAAWISGIPCDGPDENTSEFARNVWEEVEQEWPFFPRLHRLLSTRPNVIPVAITTGVGPQGESTIFYQVQPPRPPSPTCDLDDNIDPTLRGLDVNQPSTLPQSTQAPSGMTGTPVKTASPPTMTPDQKRLADAVAKADKSIKTVPKKRALEDQFIDATQETLRLVRQRMESKEADKKAHLQLEQQRHWLKEFELGLISKRQYRLNVYGAEASSSQPERPVAPTRRVRSPSPVWDIESDREEVHGSDDPIDTSVWTR